MVQDKTSASHGSATMCELQRLMSVDMVPDVSVAADFSLL